MANFPQTSINTQLMKTLLLFLVIVVPFQISDLQAAVPESISAIAGTYTGRAYNGNNMDPVVTVLVFDSQGRFSGNYQVSDEDGFYAGRLSNLIPEGNGAFSLEWTDQFGEGFVYLEFNADYSSFNGYWTSLDSEEQFPWNGRRQ